MNALTRFFGGPPLWVILRLIVFSIVVGIVLQWLDITPFALVDRVVSFVRRLVDRGFDAVRDIGSYLVVGAMVVVPVWLVMRVLGTTRGR
jgi:hypothetical protein